MLNAQYATLFFFFFNDPATTDISPLPLPDALPIYPERPAALVDLPVPSSDSPSILSATFFPTVCHSGSPTTKERASRAGKPSETQSQSVSGLEIGRAHV